MLPVQATRSLPLLYHLNSEPLLNPDLYASEGYQVLYKRMGRVEAAIALPRVISLNGVGALLQQRSPLQQLLG